MFTLALIFLTVLVLTGLAVLIAEHLPFGRETYTLSTREFPNIADRQSASRDTAIHQ